MRIQLNGAWRDLAALAQDARAAQGATAAQCTASPTLAAMLRLWGYGSSTVATAVNGEFVPARKRDEIQLHDGDRVEVLAPMQGG
ncbi:MAG TPA: sulfur carrier protein ThiS [Steroidobacteraceae bacterium]|nr:sulfur carrier protein ThiS [Steroidobacteraceae bacterium]